MLLLIMPTVMAAVTQSVEGQIVAGVLVSASGTGVHEAPPGAIAVPYSLWVRLAKVAAGHEPVTLSFTSEPLGGDMSVIFYNKHGVPIAYNGCATHKNPETCEAPAGAVYALVKWNLDLDATFTFTYEYESAG